MQVENGRSEQEGRNPLRCPVGRGHPPLRHLKYLDLGLDREKLAAMYVECGTFEQLASKLGVTRQTVQKWFRRLGLRGEMRKPHIMKPEHRSSVAKWLRAHPDVSLPRSIDKAAAIVGVKPYTFENFIERRRARVAKYVLRLGALPTYPRVLRDDAGRFLPPKAIAAWGIHVDRWTLEVVYDGTLKVGTEFKLTLPYSKVVEMWKDVEV